MKQRFIFMQPRTVEITANFHDAKGTELLRFVQSKREIRLTLQPGDRFPEVVKRGQRVDLKMALGDQIGRLTGRVRFRRLNVAVIEGTMTFSKMAAAADRMDEVMG